jgi:UDP-4-amino-4-deoxy-L-arabinose-oxoglutarate aminotransferase
MLAQGAMTPRFEEKMSDWLGANGAVAVGSGGAALELALRALDCGPKSEVILPTYVCRTILDAVVSVGAQPIFCDIGPNWVIEVKNLRPLITSQTRAVIAPHMYGIFADISSIRSLGVPIIEDAAQALGATKQHGIQGELIVLSFHPTKCMTTGEGGMVLSRDTSLVEKCRQGRDATERTFGRQFSPLSEIASALGLSQLTRYSEFLRLRQEMATIYQRELGRLSCVDIQWLIRTQSMYFRFPFQCDGGIEAYQEAFQRKGIHIRRGVDRLLHRSLGFPDADFPTATEKFETTLSLPIYPSLSDQELRTCVLVASEILGS